MMQFLIAAAIGFIFASRWTSLMWPVGAALVVIITVTASLLYSSSALFAVLVTVFGYNAGLLAATLLVHTGLVERLTLRIGAARGISSRT